MRSRARYTNEELERRERARTILDKPDAEFETPEKARHHKSRALGDLRRTEEAARARATQRDAQGSTPAALPPDRWPEKPEEKAARERFLQYIKSKSGNSASRG